MKDECAVMPGSLNMNRKKRILPSDQSGVIAVLVAVCLVVLLLMTGLVVDYSFMTIVSGELNKAAEAGALAGVPALYTPNLPAPNWSRAESLASQTVLANQVNGQLLTSCQVSSGYFSLTGKKVPLQSQATVPTNSDVPAVWVTVAKSEGNNGGPLQLFFGSLWGVRTVNLQGQAVATLSYPIGIPPGIVMPLAAKDSQAIFNQYWVNDTSFTIGVNGNDVGQWTSFKKTTNSASYVAGLIAKGNPDYLQVNDYIYIQTGVKASNYGNVRDTLAGKTVYIPLVADTATGWQKITGFSAFKVESASQPEKYVQGHFDKNAAIPRATKISPARPSPLSTLAAIPQMVNFSGP
jgi:Flp pilus assembly protein TadG